MKSIRQQLTLTLLLGFGLLLVLSCTAIYSSTRVALLAEFDAGLRTKALAIMVLTEQSPEGIRVESSNAFFQQPIHDATPQFFEVRQTNGTLCARSESLGGDGLTRPAVLPSSPTYWNLTLPTGHAGRAFGLRFTPKAEDEAVGRMLPIELIAVVAADRQAIDQTLATLALVLVVTGLLTLIITVPLVRFCLRHGHAPLDQLAQQAAAITADSLQTRFLVASLPQELRPIATRLNDLLGRLEHSFERERRFSADLAHELRTPLAELRTLAEVELAWPEGGATEKHREVLNIALQMEAMVARLLELARCENGMISLQLESVAIAPLVTEVWQPLADKAKAKGLIVHHQVPPDAFIQSDRTLLRSILNNLFSNAVEYAPQNGQVEINWQSDRGELAVSNTVHDLKADDVPHLFERLWRKDKSRTSGDHCGLGLAVSQTFAEMLGSVLKAQFSAKDTLKLTLKFRSSELCLSK